MITRTIIDQPRPPRRIQRQRWRRWFYFAAMLSIFGGSAALSIAAWLALFRVALGIWGA